MARIADRLRQQVIERANGRCEYCQTRQVVVVSMEIDHIIPEGAGGKTILDNLCFACIGCNGFKLDYQTGIDPETEQEVPLYNPRSQDWHAHFRWRDDGIFVTGLTVVGRATINRLKMNREAVCEARRLWVSVGWHPPR